VLGCGEDGDNYQLSIINYQLSINFSYYTNVLVGEFNL
jgi:hypothetical protein